MADCLQTKALRRIQTTPYGSESTSAYWYENVNNCAYWISVVQHPYGESDQSRIKELPSTGAFQSGASTGPHSEAHLASCSPSNPTHSPVLDCSDTQVKQGSSTVSHLEYKARADYLRSNAVSHAGVAAPEHGIQRAHMNSKM